MNKYIAYIDETGSFSFQSSMSNNFVGGWICKHDARMPPVLEQLFKNCVAEFNQSKGKNKLRYPGDMHFMPMHTDKAKRAEKYGHLQMEHTDAPEFFSHIFQKVKNFGPLFLFRSVGGPAIIAHEQAAYMEILRNTLVQLVDHPVFPTEFSLTIIIAWRRTQELTGYLRDEDLPAYELHLAGQLKKELESSFVGSFKPNISVNFGDARKNPGLILADFFCGAMKKKKYLSGFTIEKYSFHRGYRVIGSRTVQQIQYLLEQDAAAGLFQGIQIHSAGADNKELWELLTKTHKKLADDERNRLYTSIHRYLDDLLINNQNRYDMLETGKAFIASARMLLSDSLQNMRADQLRLKAMLDLHSIRISSHSGAICSDIVKEYIQFLHSHGSRFFKSRMEFMQYLIDGALIGVQVEAFNRLRFDNVQANLEPVQTLYNAVYKHLPGLEGMADENRAKLEGSMGQMYGFLVDLSPEKSEQNKYYDLALTSLEKDVASCQSGGYAWRQGMGYLTALHWKNGELEKARKQFFLETSTTRKNQQDLLYNLSEYDLFGCIKDHYFMLHRLCICALAKKNGREVTGLATLQPHIGSAEQIHRYPRSLSAKWLAVLFMFDGQYQQALNLLDNVLASDKGNDFAIEFILLPHKLLRKLCKQKLGMESKFSLSDEIISLQAIEPSARNVLGQLGINRFQEYSHNWDPYEIASLPPFYYA